MVLMLRFGVTSVGVDGHLNEVPRCYTYHNATLWLWSGRDKERGVVWEESIIMMSKAARFVFLSATIPNAREFAEWIATIHRYTCRRQTACELSRSSADR